MKKVILVNIQPIYIDNNTGQTVKLTEKEKLLNLFTSQYSFSELYTKLAVFQAKTYKQLDVLISDYSTTNKIYDFQSIIIKK